jgi:hypothetical protein
MADVSTEHTDQTHQTDPAESPTARKDPAEWVTGDEPMTGPQASYLRTLAHEAGEPYEPELTKAEASERIDELQHETGRAPSP